MAVDFFKALADETRLLLMVMISRSSRFSSEGTSELCVCELTTGLALSQPKISRHLAILRKANLILSRRQGKWVYYRLSEQLPTWQLVAVHAAVDDVYQAAKSQPCSPLAEKINTITARMKRASIKNIDQQPCC